MLFTLTKSDRAVVKFMTGAICFDRGLSKFRALESFEFYSNIQLFRKIDNEDRLFYELALDANRQSHVISANTSWNEQRGREKWGRRRRCYPREGNVLGPR